MQYFKVCPLDDDVNDPAAWGLAYAATYREAAIEHFKYLSGINGGAFHERDMLVTLEAGGVAKSFRVRVIHTPIYSAEETLTRHEADCMEIVRA